jgi:ABC-2 type transport system permease protein
MSESVIHDIGYQRYDVPRLGRGYVLTSLYTQGLRAVFGFGRGAKSKIFPWLVSGVIYLVAVVLTAIRSQGAPTPLTYWNFGSAVWLLTALFCAVVAPELVSRDIRGTVLPLYFSRPLRRTDYAIAKLLAMMSAVFILLAGPETVMLLGGVFTVDGFSAVMTEIGHWGQGLLIALVYALVFGGVSLLIASLAGRRGVAAAMIAAFFLVTSALYAVVIGLNAARAGGGEASRDAARAATQWAGVVSPSTLVQGVSQWWFDPEHHVGNYGPLYAVVGIPFVLLCVGLLLLRYWRVAR